MKRLFILALCSLLLACGKSSVPSENEGGGGSQKEEWLGDAFLASLDGKTTKDVLVETLTKLSESPTAQSRAQWAKLLDQKWEIHCEQRCEISKRN